MKIFGLRYFSIKSQNTLFGPPEHLQPSQFFLYALQQNINVQYYGKTYTTRIIQQSVDNRYLIGWFLKSVDLSLI